MGRKDIKLVVSHPPSGDAASTRTVAQYRLATVAKYVSPITTSAFFISLLEVVVALRPVVPALNVVSHAAGVVQQLVLVGQPGRHGCREFQPEVAMALALGARCLVLAKPATTTTTPASTGVGVVAADPCALTGGTPGVAVGTMSPV